MYNLMKARVVAEQLNLGQHKAVPDVGEIDEELGQQSAIKRVPILLVIITNIVSMVAATS